MSRTHWRTGVLLLGISLLMSAHALGQLALGSDEVEVPAEILAVDRPQSPPATHVDLPAWQGARAQGIERLLKLARREKTASRLGFQRPPAAADLTVLEPLGEAVVQLEDLKTYQAGQDPKALVKVLERVSFPIIVGGKVRSSMTLSKLNGAWKPTSFGAPGLMRASMRARINGSRVKAGAKLVLNAGRAARYTLVTVTGLNQYFLAADGPRGLYLIPLFDGRFGPRGVPQKAADVWLKLVPEAKKHNGLPT